MIARNTLHVTPIEIPSKFAIKVCDFKIFDHQRGRRHYVAVIAAVGLRKKAAFPLGNKVAFLNVAALVRLARKDQTNRVGLRRVLASR